MPTAARNVPGAQMEFDEDAPLEKLAVAEKLAGTLGVDVQKALADTVGALLRVRVGGTLGVTPEEPVGVAVAPSVGRAVCVVEGDVSVLVGDPLTDTMTESLGCATAQDKDASRTTARMRRGSGATDAGRMAGAFCAH